MYAPFVWASLLACVGSDGKDGTDDSEPLVLTDEWPDFTPAGDAVYIRYDDVPNMVRATPDGVEVLDLGGRTALWADATPDGRLLLVLTEGDAGVEHVLVEDGAIVMAFPDQETNRIEMSPDGRHLALWYDDALDPHTNLLVEITQVTLVDTQAGTAARISTGVAPKTVSLTETAGLVVGPTGALGLDLETQAVTQAYDFADEGIADGSWGYWGVISPDDAYAFVSGDQDERDDTVVRLGLGERSVHTISAPLSYEYDGWLDERSAQLFRVGEALFAYNDTRGLWSLDPGAITFAPIDEDMRFSMIEEQADRAVLYGESSGTWLLWTDPTVELHQDRVTSGTNTVWFGEDHALMQRYTGGTWHAGVLELATGATWETPLQDVPEWAAVADVAGAPTALLKINDVEGLALLPLVESSALVPTDATWRGPFAAMADDEAFYIGGVYEHAGYIGFVDPVTGVLTEYDDLSALDLMAEP